MGCGSSHHVSEHAIVPDHGGILHRQRRKQKQKQPHGNLLNLIDSSADVSRSVLKLAQKQSAAFEDLELFARDPRDHDGDNVELVKVAETLKALNGDLADSTRILVASQNAYVHTAQRLLVSYRQVDTKQKAAKDAASKSAAAESTLESAKHKEIKARDTVKYEQNKPKLMGHIADCETKLEEAKAAVVTAKEELGAQRLQLRSDKERAVKQMLFSLNQAYSESNKAQLKHLENSLAAILALPGPDYDVLLVQSRIDNAPAGAPTSPQQQQQQQQHADAWDTDAA